MEISLIQLTPEHLRQGFNLTVYVIAQTITEPRKEQPVVEVVVVKCGVKKKKKQTHHRK